MKIYTIRRNRKTNSIIGVLYTDDSKKNYKDYEKLVKKWNDDLENDSTYEISDDQKVNEVIKYISELQEIETDETLREEVRKLERKIESAVRELEGY